jgi:hypothetical protein
MATPVLLAELLGPAAGLKRARRSTHDISTTHNARHQRDPDSQGLFASVPEVRGSLVVKSRVFGPNSTKAAV